MSYKVSQFKVHVNSIQWSLYSLTKFTSYNRKVKPVLVLQMDVVIIVKLGSRSKVYLKSLMGDYLNFVGKNKKVHDFSLKLGVTHWGITFFVIKKFWSAPGGPLQHFLKNTNFCIEKGTLAILVIAATIFKLQKVAIPFWKGNCSPLHVVWLK